MIGMPNLRMIRVRFSVSLFCTIALRFFLVKNRCGIRLSKTRTVAHGGLINNFEVRRLRGRNSDQLMRVAEFRSGINRPPFIPNRLPSLCSVVTK
jgi:hypothetical protein